MTYYGVMTDYEHNLTHKLERLQVWCGPFASIWVAEANELPRHSGYMLSLYGDEKLRVECPSPRTSENYEQIDAAINAALNAHYPKGL